MSNRPVFFLWISIKVRNDRRFRLVLPIPLFPLFILTDIAEDAAIFWSLFSGKKKAASPPRLKLSDFSADDLKHPTPDMLKSASVILHHLLSDMVFRWGPMDIVDVDVKSDKEHVRVLCSLR